MHLPEDPTCPDDLTHPSELLVCRMPGLRAWVAEHIPARFRALVSADDILQEVWLAMLRADRGSVRDWQGWITVTTRTVLLGVLRAARAQRRGGDWCQLQPARHRTSLLGLLNEVAPDSHTPSRDVSATEARHAVAVALATLPADQRDAIYLCYIDEVPRSEVARKMNKSESAVNGLIWRGLQNLRESMHDAEQRAKLGEDKNNANG